MIDTNPFVYYLHPFLNSGVCTHQWQGREGRKEIGEKKYPHPRRRMAARAPRLHRAALRFGDTLTVKEFSEGGFPVQRFLFRLNGLL